MTNHLKKTSLIASFLLIQLGSTHLSGMDPWAVVIEGPIKELDEIAKDIQSKETELHSLQKIIGMRGIERQQIEQTETRIAILKSQIDQQRLRQRELEALLKEVIEAQMPAQPVPAPTPPSPFATLAEANNQSPFDGMWFVERRPVNPNIIAPYQNLFEVSQSPALSQRRSADDQTNFCGYYCIFNAGSLAQNQPGRIMSRDQFGPQFAAMLESIAIMRKLQAPVQITELENLGSNEITCLLEKEKFEKLMNNVLYLDEQVMRLLLDPTFTGPQKDLFQNFQDGRKMELIIIYNVPGTNHYITVLAQRMPKPDNQNFISFTIYDSLGINYVDPQSDIRDRILPLYLFLIQ